MITQLLDWLAALPSFAHAGICLALALLPLVVPLLLLKLWMASTLTHYMLHVRRSQSRTNIKPIRQPSERGGTSIWFYIACATVAVVAMLSMAGGVFHAFALARAYVIGMVPGALRPLPRFLTCLILPLFSGGAVIYALFTALTSSDAPESFPPEHTPLHPTE